ncbi:Uncharacterized protein FWK35_00001706 [Aphis craccivora]|uniref:RNase H type-1 domain-containing protein n=1 Tax=Aphis craccivora TaxID=307492 RepID=A0A6G0ZGI6_APHCR|nr:Uncharacterized protein FWK35_00001706 [Aphis craccivora]
MFFDINLEISEFKKENTNSIMYRNVFQNTLQKYPNYKQIYADVSKTDQNVGISIITENSSSSYKLPPECSIYTAEALAIYKALQNITINKETSCNKYLILSDSLGSLTGINNLTNPSDISKLIHEETYELTFLWIPGHCGIDGNELANQEASKAASSTDIHILNFIWRNPGLNRKDETIINRLRIGHTFATYNYLMARKDPPICETRGVEFTVKHIIIDCSKYADSTSKHSIPYQFSEALQPDLQSNINIVNFLKETKLLKCIIRVQYRQSHDELMLLHTYKILQNNQKS